MNEVFPRINATLNRNEFAKTMQEAVSSIYLTFLQTLNWPVAHCVTKGTIITIYARMFYSIQLKEAPESLAIVWSLSNI